MAPFYSILFANSFCQFNSSEYPTIITDKFEEHLTRDQSPFLHPESLQILQIHSSMLILLFSFLGFRSGNWDGHGRTFILCSVTHFLCWFWWSFWIIVLLEDPTACYKAFWPQDLTIFCNYPAVILGESLATQAILLALH